MEATRTITYVCTSCESVDHVSLFDNEPVPPAINCWNCHAGMNKDIGRMISERLGMFPQVIDTLQVVAG